MKAPRIRPKGLEPQRELEPAHVSRSKLCGDMDEAPTSTIALTAAVSELAERIDTLIEHLDAARSTAPAGRDRDARLARAAKLAALRGIDTDGLEQR